MNENTDKQSPLTLESLGITIKLSPSIPPVGTIETNWMSGEDPNDSELLAAYDALESIILAHACSGIKVTSQEYLSGIQVALDAIQNYVNDEASEFPI